MFKSISIFLISVSLIFSAVAEEQQLSCKTSYNCPSGTCCRSSEGLLLTSSSNFGIFPIFGQENQEGTCQERLGQLNEICDGSCGCEEGLTCYRPMSGACCPPMRCYTAEWVSQQIAYWSNCHPPTCFYPARDSLSF